MQRYLTCLVALSLLAWPALAGANGGETSAEKPAAAAAAKPENSPANEPVAKPESPSMELQLGQLRSLLEAQAEELRAQHAALLEQQKKMAALEEQLRAARAVNSANSAGDNADVAAPVADASFGVSAPSPAQGDKKAEEGPASLRYKGITITPGGFVAAETVYRSHAVSGDINTPFTGFPFPGAALAKVAENNFTARQSRLSLLGESKIGSTKLTGYWEADWLGAGVTSNNRQSNSYVMRQRIIYAQAAFESGWIFTGGQQWSLATETRKGITNRQEILPMTIDSQYQVGFTWERQYGFRVVKDFGGKFALGFALEGPQATIGGRGFSQVATTKVGSASVATIGNTFLDAPGAGGALYNFTDTTGYSINKSPDIVFKATLDPGFGHYELFGVVSPFRNRIYPCGVVGTNATDTAPPAMTTTVSCTVNGTTSSSPSSAGAINDTRTGGGFGANFRIPLFNKKLEVAAQAMGGDGVGRYGSAQLADLTFRPDGTQALIRTAHGLGELVFHPTPMLDIYADFGAEYAWRAAYQGYNSISIVTTPAIPATMTTPAVAATTTTTFKLNQIGGYGSPFANNSGCSTELPPNSTVVLPAASGSAGLFPANAGNCAGDTRIVMEATIGFWHKFYQGPKGGLRWGIQYSYFTRSAWSGNNTSPSVSPQPAGTSPKATDQMIWTSFRYYLP